jgi:ribosomal protein L7/L12
MRSLLFVVTVSLAEVGLLGGCADEAASTTEAAPRSGQVEISDEVKQALENDDTITRAVKLHQQKTGLSLTEAKKQVEAFQLRHQE